MHESPRPRELVFEMMRDGLLHYNCNSSFIVSCRLFISLCVISTPGSDNGNRQFLLFARLQLVTWAHLFSVMNSILWLEYSVIPYNCSVFNSHANSRHCDANKLMLMGFTLFYDLWDAFNMWVNADWKWAIGHTDMVCSHHARTTSLCLLPRNIENFMVARNIDGKVYFYEKVLLFHLIIILLFWYVIALARLGDERREWMSVIIEFMHLWRREWVE